MRSATQTVNISKGPDKLKASSLNHRQELKQNRTSDSKGKKDRLRIIETFIIALNYLVFLYTDAFAY